MKYTNIKVNSNLGYVENSTVNMELVHDSKNDYVKLEFSTGFKTECKYVGNKRDYEGNQILTYSYGGYNDETHYLIIRIVGETLYCQTVQTASNPGGSTWIIEEDKEKNLLINDMHQEIFDQFHIFRKSKGNAVDVLINGKEMNEIIRLSKLKIKGKE